MNTVVTGTRTRLQKVTDLIQEYADCRQELSAEATAKEIDSLYKEDVVIALALRSYWIHQADGVAR